jgi:hypothetical protein
MHHTGAYSATLTVAANSENEIQAVVDNYFTIQNNHFLPQRDVNLLYACGMGATITKQRINTPSLGVITSPFIMPLSGVLGASSPQKIRWFDPTELKLSKLEELQVFTTHTAATAEQNVTVFGFDMGQIAEPPGNVYCIRGTGTATLVATTWTNINPIVWQNTLPNGLYAVVGAAFQSATCLAGRIIFENTPYRPGAVGQQAITDWTNDIFRNGGLGVWGQFHNYAMPQIEFLASGADAAETVFLDLVKIG